MPDRALIAVATASMLLSVFQVSNGHLLQKAQLAERDCRASAGNSIAHYKRVAEFAESPEQRCRLAMEKAPGWERMFKSLYSDILDVENPPKSVEIAHDYYVGKWHRGDFTSLEAYSGWVESVQLAVPKFAADSGGAFLGAVRELFRFFGSEKKSIQLTEWSMAEVHGSGWEFGVTFQFGEENKQLVFAALEETGVGADRVEVDSDHGTLCLTSVFPSEDVGLLSLIPWVSVESQAPSKVRPTGSVAAASQASWPVSAELLAAELEVGDLRRRTAWNYRVSVLFGVWLILLLGFVLVRLRELRTRVRRAGGEVAKAKGLCRPVTVSAILWAGLGLSTSGVIGLLYRPKIQDYYLCVPWIAILGGVGLSLAGLVTLRELSIVVRQLARKT